MIPGLGRSPGEANGSPLHGESHGQRTLAGNPWGHKSQTQSSDRTINNSRFYPDFSFQLLSSYPLVYYGGVREDRAVLDFSVSDPALSYNSFTGDDCYMTARCRLLSLECGIYRIYCFKM